MGACVCIYTCNKIQNINYDKISSKMGYYISILSKSKDVRYKKKYENNTKNNITTTRKEYVYV